jgi:ABC-type transport system involved in cytochrome bd biosynthesis fused ATPase/permease subunit
MNDQKETPCPKCIRRKQRWETAWQATIALVFAAIVLASYFAVFASGQRIGKSKAWQPAETVTITNTVYASAASLDNLWRLVGVAGKAIDERDQLRWQRDQYNAQRDEARQERDEYKRRLDELMRPAPLIVGTNSLIPLIGITTNFPNRGTVNLQ